MEVVLKELGKRPRQVCNITVQKAKRLMDTVEKESICWGLSLYFITQETALKGIKLIETSMIEKGCVKDNLIVVYGHAEEGL